MSHSLGAMETMPCPTSDMPPDRPEGPVPPPRLPDLRILHLDEDCVAVAKPTGVPVHRTRGIGRAPILLQCLRDAINRHIYPIHRLDRATSGVIVFGLTSEAAAACCASFREGNARKTYLGVVRGYTPEAEIVDYALPRDEGCEPRPAVTEYRTIARLELPFACGPYPTARYSLVVIRPRTGRRHQIRRHFHHISHPIIGDTQYGDGRHNRLFREKQGIHRLMLQAIELRLPHPRTGRELCIADEPDPEFLTLFPEGIPL